MRVPFRLTTVVWLSLVFAATVFAAAESIRTIAGNPVFKRAGVDGVRGNFYLLDTNHPFTADGKLTHWEIYAETTNPVQLVIVRNTGGALVEVGRSPVETPTIGYNLFSLPRRRKIDVLAGDLVGAYTSAGATISNSVDRSAAGTCFPNLYNSVWFSFTADPVFTCSQDRHYSLRAFRRVLREDED